MRSAPSLKRTCYTCAQFGHKAKDCPNAGNPSCYNCGELGHLSKECTVPKRDKSCYYCGQQGHLMRECTENGMANIPEPKGYNFRQTGNSAKEYGEKSEDQEPTAITNHSNPINGRKRGPTCYTCKSYGHIARECPQGQRCYNCGELGHLSKDCSQAPEKRCYTCKEVGHISSQCPQAT